MPVLFPKSFLITIAAMPKSAEVIATDNIVIPPIVLFNAVIYKLPQLFKLLRGKLFFLNKSRNEKLCRTVVEPFEKSRRFARPYIVLVDKRSAHIIGFTALNSTLFDKTVDKGVILNTNKIQEKICAEIQYI